MAANTIKLTETDKTTLAILYCLYGHEPFIWVIKGKFQWYFGATNRAKNRLVKLGLLQCQEVYYAEHWLASRDICWISPQVQFDDQAIQQAIVDARIELQSKGHDYTGHLKPYPINDPEYTFANLPKKPDFLAMVESLPKFSKYLIGSDVSRIRFHAQYWPREAVAMAAKTLTLDEKSS